MIAAAHSLEKQGNIVYLSVFLEPMTTLPDTWKGMVLGTLPVGYRPKRNKIFSISLANPNSYVRIDITTSGQLQLTNIGAYVGGSGYFGFNISYPAAKL